MRFVDQHQGRMFLIAFLTPWFSLWIFKSLDPSAKPMKGRTILEPDEVLWERRRQLSLDLDEECCPGSNVFVSVALMTSQFFGSESGATTCGRCKLPARGVRLNIVNDSFEPLYHVLVGADV